MMIEEPQIGPMIVTAALMDQCFGHQGEGKKLRKQEERNRGAPAEERWRKDGEDRRTAGEENISEAKNSFLRHSLIQSSVLDRVDLGTDLGCS